MRRSGKHGTEEVIITSGANIELVFFEGCPNVSLARENLRAALQGEGKDTTWTEWDLLADSTPKRFHEHGSPTILIDGRDVTGDPTSNAAMSCRADGVPSTALIMEKLR